MKSIIWLFQLPIILLLTGAFLVVHLGETGELDDPFLRANVFPVMRNISGFFTDARFKLRGPQPPKNRVVVVGVDEDSIRELGRWPWHRDMIGFLITRIFESGAKVVGMDMVFSEEDRRVPDELTEALKSHKLEHLTASAETDLVLQQVISHYGDRLVLGWASEGTCQPAYDGPEYCPVGDKEKVNFPEGFEKFAISDFKKPIPFNLRDTTVVSTTQFLVNIPLFQDVAKHSGSFDAQLDPDGVVRHASLLRLGSEFAFPGLALEMARVGMNEDLSIQINKEGNIDFIRFKNSGAELPVTPQGVAKINFRGGGYTFPYLSALEVMQDSETIHQIVNRMPASVSRFDVLKDAYVIIGATALGVNDMRTFPFQSNVAGVEGHANILDNVLSNDFLIPTSRGNSLYWMLALMLVIATLYAYATEKLEALPALGLFLFVFAGFAFFDVNVLFENRHIWETGFFYIEIATIFVLTLAAKYVLEERQKKFIHSAFGRYVSPAMVDTIIKDPSRLSLGGEKKELTILFSDIRGFTTLSEKMDAKHLAAFLNHYLGKMTDIIVVDCNGTLDKYIGDAIMAFWGAPIDQKNHAANACRAAVKMQQALATIREEIMKQYGIEVRAGIGLNSGMVNVGNMGSEKNFNYTVIGDHVNLASRLEGLTKYYGVGVVTSRYTLDSIQASGEPAPAHRVLDFVKVKGKQQAVELLEVIDRDLPEASLRKFEQARVLYTQQKWDDAIKLFKETADELQVSPDELDGPSVMYLERCEMFKQTPPASDWDGSWEMTSK